jgi:hypothetical protein
MSYKPDEVTLMTYLYGELEGQEKEKLEQYLSENPKALQELRKLQALRKTFQGIPDKEIIAPPIFVNENNQPVFWQSAYFKAVVSIAASLVLIIMVGKFSGLRVNYTDQELKIAFGQAKVKSTVQTDVPVLTSLQVQELINTSLNQNNALVQASLQESQQHLNAAIQNNLKANSNKIDNLIQQASSASQAQIQQYVMSLQNENTKLVKEYFQLSAADQKKYMEDLLVDFAKYVQQQRSSDLQLVQTRLNNLEKNTDMFKQETEQILSSIITSAGTSGSRGIKN